MTEKEAQIRELKEKISQMSANARISPNCQCYAGTYLQVNQLRKQLQKLEEEVAAEKAGH